MPNAYHTRRTPNTITTTTAATLYPANNLFNDSIAKPWNATSAIQHDIDFNITTGVVVQAVNVHDVNFASAEVWVKVGAGAFAKVGDMTTYRDKSIGRRRGRYVIGGTANVTGVRIRILAGTPTDGTVWRIGSMSVWGAVIALPPGPEWGYDPRLVRARVANSLPNQQRAVAATGRDFQLIACHMAPRGTENWDAFFDALRVGVLLFDMNLSAKGWEVWPVIWEDDGMNNPQEGPVSESFNITLREVIAA